MQRSPPRRGWGLALSGAPEAAQALEALAEAGGEGVAGADDGVIEEALAANRRVAEDGLEAYYEDAEPSPTDGNEEGAARRGRPSSRRGGRTRPHASAPVRISPSARPRR